MEGMIQVSYTIMCKKDVNIALTLTQVLQNEKVAKAIKSEFASGMRNLSLLAQECKDIYIKTTKEIYTLNVAKNDFADLLELAEEDARKQKRLKKECDGVELVDIKTLE